MQEELLGARVALTAWECPWDCSWWSSGLCGSIQMKKQPWLLLGEDCVQAAGCRQSNALQPRGSRVAASAPHQSPSHSGPCKHESPCCPQPAHRRHTLPKRLPPAWRIVGNEMQIDRETMRLSCEPFRRGPVFKSQPDCLSGNLHSINRRDFLFKLELFFFSRGHLKLITSARLLYKRGLCGCDYRVWSVRRRLSWHGEGEGPVHMNLVNSRALPAAVRSVWVCSACYGR